MEYIISKQWKRIASVVKNILQTKNRSMLSSTCAICGKKKLTFVKNQEIHKFSNKFKMSKLFKKCLLTGEKIARFAFKTARI